MQKVLRPEGTYSTRDVAKLLGVSTAMVKFLKDTGRLTVKERLDGWNFYEKSAVDEFSKVYKPSASHAKRAKKPFQPKMHGGMQTARVFKCFREGTINIADVVLQTKASPEFVAECWELYRMTPRELLAKKQAEEEKAEAERIAREQREDDREKRKSIEKQKLLLIRQGKLDRVTHG